MKEQRLIDANHLIGYSVPMGFFGGCINAVYVEIQSQLRAGIARCAGQRWIRR